ncbi:pyridoxal 5'-phosphate synthase glutaminase subunit PdxT [Cellulosilyticum ruminicola]|uniref:pyridoxal 5'-phosphate synthase glutaminase subunit PdxT n=1 Tax=Cellulosilyticum ruminicola TaxID=425254 RepID=UPI0006D1E971|nr:pyridoxal 5'-phosphate synthase glutaminase subunit PdxT [Cellulosilyticum ruminicola]
MKTIGVLGLQGGVAEHLTMLNEIDNINAIKVNYLSELDKIDGLIIPGGESTTLGKLLRSFNMLEPLKQMIKQGLPTWGTCAGMILLSKNIEGESKCYLGTMDISVKRNAYGRQLGSFQVERDIDKMKIERFPLIFIRAPYVIGTGKDVDIILKEQNEIVACRQANMLATSFHPELTNDKRVHEYFIKELVN